MDQRINVAKANSAAVEGENLAKARVAQANADLREAEAEAERRATAAEKIAQANALKEAYEAQREAEDVRAKREQSTLEADVIVKAEIEKQKLELEAEAMAEQTRRKARGEADAIFAVKEAEARGLYEVLSKQAEGFDKLVKSGGPIRRRGKNAYRRQTGGAYPYPGGSYQEHQNRQGYRLGFCRGRQGGDFHRQLYLGYA